MDITPLIKDGEKIIKSYGSGRFQVNGDIFESPLIVLSEAVYEWQVERGAGFRIEDFYPLVAVSDRIDVVLVGTGAKLTPLEGALMGELKSRGLNIEAMDTGAACRTYNVLMAEGRRVAAALLPV